MRLVSPAVCMSNADRNGAEPSVETRCNLDELHFATLRRNTHARAHRDVTSYVYAVAANSRSRLSVPPREQPLLPLFFRPPARKAQEATLISRGPPPPPPSPLLRGHFRRDYFPRPPSKPPGCPPRMTNFTRPIYLPIDARIDMRASVHRRSHRARILFRGPVRIRR